MAKIRVDAWQCEFEGCEHIWLSEHQPMRCAKCKRYNWHQRERFTPVRVSAAGLLGASVSTISSMNVAKPPRDRDADFEGRYRKCKHDHNEWTCTATICKLATNRI